jgi:hypothetical protein
MKGPHHQRRTGQAEQKSKQDVSSRLVPSPPLFLRYRCCCCAPSSASQIRPPTDLAASSMMAAWAGARAAGALALALVLALVGANSEGGHALGAAPQPQGPRRRAPKLGPHARQPLHLVPRHLRQRQPRHAHVSILLLPPPCYSSLAHALRPCGPSDSELGP